jgi:serine/threonine protein kinase
LRAAENGDMIEHPMGSAAESPPPAGTVGVPRASPQIVGRYAIYEQMASGGMGSVHFGRFLGPAGFARTVAIKRLHKQFASEAEFVSMLADEARLASRIRHPNVVQTLDVVESDEGLCVVMEYVHGEPLNRLLRASSGSMPASVAVAVVIGALRGLHAAHEAQSEAGEPLGIIHRDVSPQNILVGADGQARVLDFGVAKATVRLTSTRDGQLKGKLAYMSPEQLQGEEIDRRSDIYAASVVLWEALAGVRLFEGMSEGALLKRILEGVKRGPSSANRVGKTLDMRSMQVIEQLDSVVLRGLDPDPKKRYATAREMALALASATKVASVEAVEEWVLETARPVLARRAKVLLAIETQSEPPRASSSVAPPPAEKAAAGEEFARVEKGDSALRSAVQPARTLRRTGGAFLIAACVPPLLAVAVYALWPREARDRAGTASAIAPPPSSPTLPTAEPRPVAAPPPVPTASAAFEVDPPAADVAAATAPAASPHHAPPTSTKPPSVRSFVSSSSKPATASSAPSRATRDCDPPYTLDDQGVRIPKPECL